MTSSTIPATFKQVIEELAANSELVNEAQIDDLVKAILAAKRLFISGAGRSGFVARAFSNRLMHLGFTVYFVGEPTTPSIGAGDLIVIGSGSGGTKGPVSQAQTAQRVGAAVALVTYTPDSAIGQIAETIICLPQNTGKYTVNGQVKESVQPLGNAFEQMSWMVYDATVSKLKTVTGQSQEKMNALHANME
ncbi:SIS domain-containing protein [Escherichia coli]|nr:SIS domain-containing protein [Escherichia coli]